MASNKVLAVLEKAGRRATQEEEQGATRSCGKLFFSLSRSSFLPAWGLSPSFPWKPLPTICPRSRRLIPSSALDGPCVRSLARSFLPLQCMLMLAFLRSPGHSACRADFKMTCDGLTHAFYGAIGRWEANRREASFWRSWSSSSEGLAASFWVAACPSTGTSSLSSVELLALICVDLHGFMV